MKDMRKTILGGVAALGLLAWAGLAGAQEAATGTGNAAPMQTTPAPMSPDSPGADLGVGAADAAGGISTPEATAATGSTTAATGGDMAADGPYRSYSALEEGAWQGEIAGGHSIDSLMGRDVLGPDGEEIAEISDLVIESDNSIRKVIVDVGGFLGLGATPVALDIDQLHITPGEDGEIRTSMTREQLEALPRYERDAEGNYTTATGG